jgi:hypothetical protein
MKLCPAAYMRPNPPLNLPASPASAANPAAYD